MIGGGWQQRGHASKSSVGPGTVIGTVRVSGQAQDEPLTPRSVVCGAMLVWFLNSEEMERRREEVMERRHWPAGQNAALGK